MEKVSIIIPTIKGREELLHRLLVSLPTGVEIIIVPDEDLSLAEKRNIGALQANGDHLLFIDDDNYIMRNGIDALLKSPGDIKGMMACYDNDEHKIADGGSKRHYLSGFTRGINTNKFTWQIDEIAYQVDEVANAFMIKTRLFYHLGGFDEKHFPIDLDEADLCCRAKKQGFMVMMCPKAICYHRSITYSVIPDFRRRKNAYFMGRNKILFQEKHLTAINYVIYLSIFMPIMLTGYIICLIGRKKPSMIKYFLMGVYHGISRKLVSEQQRKSLCGESGLAYEKQRKDA